MIKYSIYDFCQTIVDFETGDAFVHFIRDSIHNKHMVRVEHFRKILMFCGFLKVTDFIGKRRGFFLNKKILLYELKGLRKNEIENLGQQFYETVVSKHLIPKIINQINIDKQEGYKVIIVSASYMPVVNPFCADHGIDLLITNEFLYNSKDIFKGKIAEKDCIFNNKVYRFLKACPDFKDNNKYSKSYGDSKSDKPILDIAENGYVVSKKHKKWVEYTNYKEIIW